MLQSAGWRRNALSGRQAFTLYSCYSRHVFEINHKIKHAMRQKTTPCWLFFAGDKPNEKAHRIRKDSTYCVIRSKKWQTCRSGKHSLIKNSVDGKKPSNRWKDRRRKELPSSRCTLKRTSIIWKSRALFPAYRLTCVAHAPPCIPRSRGPFASTLVSLPPKSPTPFTAATSPPGKKDFPSPLTLPPIAAMTLTTRAWQATSAKRAWRSILSKI